MVGKRRRGCMINHLPEEILEGILINLPVKSLLRFKCVSKQWRALISSKRFTEEYLQKSSDFANHKLIYKFYDQTHRNFRSCSLKSLVDGPEYNHFSMIPTWDHGPIGNSCSSIHIEGSCNGLVLISFDERDLLVWNPSTGLFKNIPPSSYPKPIRPHHQYHRFLFGFGYDDSTHDYKIVYIFFFSDAYRTEMYSLRSDSWKRIEDFHTGYRPQRSSGMLVNGKLHWLGRNDSSGWEFVGLDLEKEEYEIVGRPQHFRSYCGWSRSVMNLGGYLGLYCGGGSRWDVDVWVMMKYGDAESWTRIWKQSEYGLCPSLGVGIPIWFRENGDIAVRIGGNRVEVYNVKNKSLKSRVYVPDGNLRGIKCYVESLVSPFGNQEALGR